NLLCSRTTSYSILPAPALSTFFFFFFSKKRRPPTSTLFPYTTLFRSAPSRRARSSTMAFVTCCSSCRRWRCSQASRPRHDEQQRSEEHTSELQSRSDLVCRLLLEKKKSNILSQQLTMPGTNRACLARS